MSRRTLFILVALGWLSVIGLSGCASPGSTPPVPIATEREISAEARAALERLNRWDTELVDMEECPSRYPSRRIVDLGQTRGLIVSGKAQLEALGYTARWDCHEMRYGIAEDYTPICDCPPASLVP
jgi:hypothetical protein